MVPLPADALVLARRQNDVMTGAQLLGFGVSDGVLRRRLRAGHWSSPVRGVVVIPPVRNPPLAHAHAALLGCGSHDNPRALHRDRDRQNRLVGLGWTVLRTTWHDLTTDPIGVLAALFRALGIRGTIRVSS